ncbi:MAG: hypothetical protein ACREID_03800 [Planctomycetota bacterium]
MDAERRLRALERQVRWGRRAGAALLAVATFALLAGQASPIFVPIREKLERRIVLWDRESAWTHELEGPVGIALKDESGRVRAAIELDGGGAATIVLKDAAGKVVWRAPAGR